MHQKVLEFSGLSWKSCFVVGGIIGEQATRQRVWGREVTAADWFYLGIEYIFNPQKA